MKTYVAKTEDLVHRWYIVDAEGATLGRLASRVAQVIRGKHRPDFSPHMDMGDHVIIVNAEKVYVSGDKREQKTYTRYSGYQSGLTTRKLGDMLADKPEEVLTHAVKGMLPKNRLGRKLIRKLRVYRGSGHPHVGQMPETLEI
ncbi:MAG: 50S ribosomal protein L13 [bacterium]|nr:50S ribosomal protein L13 [bacterium]